MSRDIKAFSDRLRVLVEEQMQIAADLRELMKEGRDVGIEGGVMKQWIKALIQHDNGKPKALERLIQKTQDAALYAEVLGLEVPGFGEAKRFVVNQSAGDGGAPAPTNQTGVAPPGPVLSTPTVESGPELGRMLSDAASDVAAAQLAALEPISGTRDLNEERMDCYQLGTVDAVPPSNPQATASDDEPPHNPGGGHEVISASIDEGRPRAAAPPSDDDLLDIPEFLRKPPPPRAA
jgi:uncharacterized protein (UPF0335 family)